MAEPATLLATDRPALPPPPAGEATIWQLRFAGTGLSLALHIGIAAAAIYVLPSQISGAERGGSEQAIEIAFVGEEEASGTIEGAQPVPIAMVVPEAVIQSLESREPPLLVPQSQPSDPAPLSPRSEPAIVELALAEIVPADPVPYAEIVIPLPSELPSIAAELVPPPLVEFKSEQRTVEIKPQPKPRETRPAARSPQLQKMESAPRIAAPRNNPEAKGVTGEGNAAANRLATTRGGTGGATPTAGSAALGSYRSRLVAHLTRYKTYPEQAQDRGITGRNAVTITVSREGAVLASSLANPSGHALLDNATLAALKRAQPFPPMPEGGPGSITVTIGLNYELR